MKTLFGLPEVFEECLNTWLKPTRKVFLQLYQPSNEQARDEENKVRNEARIAAYEMKKERLQ